MGLDFNYGEAHWSYSGFHNVRTRLAKEIGIDINNMFGFDGNISWDTINDNLKLFLNHSDCDGELKPEECEKIIPRLITITKKWDKYDYDKINILKLINGMKEAVLTNTPLEFC